MADTPIYRKDFKILAELRLEEARVLLSKRREHGAYYLAGYAVECALKACIAKRTKIYQFPPKRKYVERVYSHNLSELLDAAELGGQLDRDMKTDTALAANWSTVKDWTEESRYQSSLLNGKDLYNAVAGPNGVLPWIKLRW